MVRDDEDVCVVCGSVCSLDDMWVLLKTKDEAANLCVTCKSIHDQSIKNFSILVYNNRGLIAGRVSRDIYNLMMYQFRGFNRVARLVSKLRRDNKK